MVRSIVVPLDGFAFGEYALPLALSLARRAETPVKLLHVLEPMKDVVADLMVYQGLLRLEYCRKKQDYLDGVIQRLRAVSDVPVTAELLEGDIVPTIRKAAENADLVVMTTRGRGPLARFWLGSVADQLVRELSVPLLLLHPSKEAPDFGKEPACRRILLPLDGTPLAEQIVPPAVELAKLMSAEMRLLRVIQSEVPAEFGFQDGGAFVTPEAHEIVAKIEENQKRQEHKAESYLRTLADRIHSMGVRAETRVVLGESPAAAILHEVHAGEAKGGIDLVALATHGYGGLKRVWLGSVADKVIRGSAVPVLVQRPRT